MALASCHLSISMRALDVRENSPIECPTFDPETVSFYDEFYVTKSKCSTRFLSSKIRIAEKNKICCKSSKVNWMGSGSGKKLAWNCLVFLNLNAMGTLCMKPTFAGARRLTARADKNCCRDSTTRNVRRDRKWKCRFNRPNIRQLAADCIPPSILMRSYVTLGVCAIFCV